MTVTLYEQGAVTLPDTTLEEMTIRCEMAANDQRGVFWWIGDMALAAERLFGEAAYQVWPEWVSPDMIARCKAVSAAYRLEDRNINATWSIHKNHAKHPDRIALVQAAVDAGQTSDENRREPATPAVSEPASEPVSESPAETPKAATTAAVSNPLENGWLLCVDISYYIRKSYAIDGVETAGKVFEKIIKMRDRLHAEKYVSDFVVCFDSPNSRRRLLTEGWATPYKSRGKKEPELVDQFASIRQMFERANVTCVSVDGEEADDVMASYAVQFPGMVSLMTTDCDLRQCLRTGKCNILLDTVWEQHPETGKWIAVDDWVNEARHLEEGTAKYKYSKEANVTGITPQQWPHLQAIAGDPTDDIVGCVGLGGKYACDLIKAFGTVQSVIAACKDGTAKLTPKKLQSVLDFEPFAETTLLLTTMRTDLNVPMITKIG